MKMKQKIRMIFTTGILLLLGVLMVACGSGSMSSDDHQTNSGTLDSGFDSILLQVKDHGLQMEKNDEIEQAIKMEGQHHGFMMGQAGMMEHMMDDMQGCHTEKDWNTHMSMMMNGMDGFREESYATNILQKVILLSSEFGRLFIN